MSVSSANTGRLRVALVTLGLDVGGQEKLRIEFAHHANLIRFELAVVSLTGRGLLAAELETAGCRVLALNEPPGLRPGMIVRLARLRRKPGSWDRSAAAASSRIST